MSYCTVSYCTVRYCTVSYWTASYCTVSYCTVSYCTVTYWTVSYCTLSYCTVSYCTVSYFSTDSKLVLVHVVSKHLTEGKVYNHIRGSMSSKTHSLAKITIANVYYYLGLAVACNMSC